MQWIIDFLSSIGSALSSLFSLLANAIMGLLQIFKLLPSLISTVTEFMGNMPVIISAFMAVTLGISITFLILGRGEGGD